MVFSVSPSVTVREVDLTTSIPAITTPPAAIAGVFRWGPINERVLISSEVELVNIFGAPSNFNGETFFTAADFLSYSNALYVTRVVSDSASKAVGAVGGIDVFEAKYQGEIANALEVSFVTTSGANDTSSFELVLFDETNSSNFVTVIDPDEVIEGQYSINFNENLLKIATSDILDVEVGDSLILGNDDFGYQTLDVIAVNSESVANTGIDIYDIQLRQRYRVAANPTKIIRAWKHIGSVGSAPLPNSMHVVVSDRTGVISGTPGIILERYENLSLTPGTKTPEGGNLYYLDVLEQRSRFINGVIDDGDQTIPEGGPSTRGYADLTGGSDGDNEAVIPFGKIAQGYDLYREANDVDVSFILQGRARGFGAEESSLANYLVSNIAEARRDCMVFISPNRASVVDVATEQAKLSNVIAYRNSLQNSSYWSMDTGYKYRYDKYNDVFRWIPLNGDIAGLASLVQPWESPAGFRKGRVRNVIKLAFNPNKSLRDQLYGRDINPVITQIGSGTILFGDKTGLGTATGSAFTRINVRRLFITVEKAIATIGAQFLFEFNDAFTQNQFRQVVDPFLRDIQGRRGIIDFRVVSDATVNTPQVIDSNTFRANIFIKPARSINFIELTFIATRTGIEFEEIVGQQF
jgi:hypothetical protein